MENGTFILNKYGTGYEHENPTAPIKTGRPFRKFMVCPMSKRYVAINESLKRCRYFDISTYSCTNPDIGNNCDGICVYAMATEEQEKNEKDGSVQ